MASRRPHRSHTASRTSRFQEGRIRLIGGEFKRRLLPVLDSPGLRPTPDRTRETLFNWLMTALPGARALDLFAGSGALGFEALSRGAGHVHMIEQERLIADRLNDNIALLGIESRVTLTASDALQWLEKTPPMPFDLVFIDPPFHKGLVAPACQQLATQGWLADEAFIYIEVEAGVAPDVPTDWQLHRETRAGESRSYLYKRSQ